MMGTKCIVTLLLLSLACVAIAEEKRAGPSVVVVPLAIYPVFVSGTYTQTLLVNWTLQATGVGYHMVLDFGIDFPWVYASNCLKPKNCQSFHTYNPASSPNSNPNDTTLTYVYAAGELTMTGTYQSDIFSLDNKGMLKSRMQFIAASSLQQPIYFPVYPNIDGPFGLAYPNTDNQELQPINNFYLNGLIPANEFAISLNSTHGALHIGGPVPGAYQSSFSYVPITQSTWAPVHNDGFFLWSGVVDDVLVNGASTGYCTSKKCVFFVDTAAGATNLGQAAPNPKVQPNCSNYNKLPTYTLVIGGQHYDLTPDNYVANVTDPTNGTVQCFSSLTTMPVTYPIILGPSWLSTYYTLFDISNKRLGFAPVGKTIV